jgi:GT2 family glycosyltransferase
LSPPPKKRPTRPDRQHQVRCTWLARDLLLIAGLPGSGDWDAVGRTGGKSVPIESSGLRFSRPDGRELGVVLLRPSEHDRGSPPDSIVLTANGTETELDREALAAAEIALDQMIAEELAGGDAPSRAALQALLVRDALPALERPGGLMLAAMLRDLRNALRDPFAPLVSGPESPQAASVELIMAIDDRSFWVVGWVRDVDRTMRDLVIITPEGQSADLLGNAYRHPRPDVREVFGDPPEERNGFATYLRLPQPSLLDSGWITVLGRVDGSASELSGPDVSRDLNNARIRILDEFAWERPDRERLRVEHALPALARLQDRHASVIEVEDVAQYGVPPEAPEISVVIPLYGRVDLVEHQLAHFGQDPELSESDIVYVLDSPELGPALDAIAADLNALYGVPFRVVKLTRNAGFSGANNIGVGRARGRLVLLLNSDVIPVHRGWLQRMGSFYDSTPRIGALGPKLVFEDLSLQHAGMYFKRELRTSLWGNLHYFKGFHRDFPPACVSRPVPAVTGACLMVTRELYQELGGLRYGYVQGGYEDSDFCIRLAEHGRRNWYLADVELYHLEAQSFPSPERQLATTYNTWLQTYLWDETVERMMREQETADRLFTGELPAPSRLSPVALGH